MLTKNIQDVMAEIAEQYEEIVADDFSANKLATNWKQRKKWMIERLTQLVEEVEAGADPILCTRKGVHTCRKGAIHVPECFCGNLNKLTTSPTSDKALQDNK